MIHVTVERSPECEKLYQFGMEKWESGTKGSVLLNLMRWYNADQKLSLSVETVKEIHASIGKAPKADGPEPCAPESDGLAQFHLWNKKGECKGAFDFRIFEHIRDEENVFILGQVPYHYRHGVYVADLSGSILKTAIRKLIYPEFIKSNVVDRIFRLFLQDSGLQVSAADLNSYPVHWINFQNGFYDPVSGELIPHDPMYLSVNQIPHEYHPGEKLSGDAVESWLRFITPDPEDRRMLLEYVGLCLTRDCRQQKFLVLVGTGGSGKSTLIRMIETLVGEDNLSHVSLRELTQRFASYGLMGMLLNSCADLEISALEDTSTLKKLLGEDSIRAESKGKDAISFRSYARLIFSCNELPLILSERTNGFYRRLMVLQMDKQPETARADFLETLQAETGYFIHLAVDALRRMYADGRIHESPASVEAVKALRCDSDTVEAFISEQCEQDGERTERGKIFSQYESWCYTSGRTSLSRTSFYRSLRAKGIKEISSGGQRYFELTCSKPALSICSKWEKVGSQEALPFV